MLKGHDRRSPASSCRCMLLGYDMKDRGGQHLMVGDHPKGVKRHFAPEKFLKYMPGLAKALDELNITVYNCTIESAIEVFQKRRLEDVLGA